MIGYRISQNELELKIKAAAPGWLEKAAQRTEEFRQKGHYEESSPIWSRVKPVYMRLQGESKCAYCERKLESEEYGTIEQDVEHFRPKSNVKPWQPPEDLKGHGIQTTPAPAQGHGYYLLPYHPFNYAAACKPCNSALKQDYFPIAGDYDLTGQDPRDLVHEKPLLIYPLGDFDTPPESLIRFHGASPQPVAASGHERARALVTIDFFKLDDAIKRKNLLRERALMIVALSALLEQNKPVDWAVTGRSAHTNCARCFNLLFETNPAEAKAVSERAFQFVLSSS